MRKICNIFWVMLAVAALCSCSKNDYQKVIPAKAPLVAKIDLRSIAEKSDFQQSKSRKTLETGLMAVVRGKDLERVKEYMDDPMQMGFDFSVPAYVFAVDAKTFGLTLQVDDKDAVRDFLLLLNKQGMATKPHEKDEWMSGTLLDDLSYSYDGSTFLLLASMENGSRANQAKLARQLMALGEQKRFVDTEGFCFLNEEDADVAVYMNPDAMSIGWLKELKMEGLLPTSMLKDIEVLTTLHFEKGEVLLKTKRYAKTEEGQKGLDELDENLRKISGVYLGQVSDDAIIWMGAGVNGKWLLSKIKENKELNNLLFAAERAVDAGLMLQAVDGDVSLALMPSPTERNGVEFLLQAQLDNSDFLNDVDDWKQGQKDFGIVMTDLGENQYQLKLDGQSYQWGVRDKDLYWATMGTAGEMGKSKGTKLQALKNKVQNSTLFLYVDMALLAEKSGAMSNVGMMSQMVKHYLDLKSISYQVLSAGEDVLIIEQKNKDENFLKQLL